MKVLVLEKAWITGKWRKIWWEEYNSSWLKINGHHNENGWRMDTK
jgi:hypothetical protein